jgi:hypothetical protein
MAGPITRAAAARETNTGNNPPGAPTTNTATTAAASGAGPAPAPPAAASAAAAGAGAQTLADACPEHLRCSICFEVFQEPHFAGCGRHAFCYACLDALAAAAAGAGGSGSANHVTTTTANTAATAAAAAAADTTDSDAPTGFGFEGAVLRAAFGVAGLCPTSQQQFPSFSLFFSST